VPSDSSEKESKKKKSKKDFLSNAVEEELNQSNSLGDFIDEVKKRNKFVHRFKRKSIKENKVDTENKNMEDNEIEQRESNSLRLSEIKDENKKRIIAFILIILILSGLGYLGYYFFSQGVSSPVIYLASNQIDGSRLSSISTDTEEVFSKGKPLYFYFTTGKRLGTDKLIVTVLELYETPEGIMKEQLAGNYEISVKPGWGHFETHFQKEVFENAGRYKLKILTKEGNLLSERLFQIR